MTIAERFTFDEARSVRRLGYGTMQLTEKWAWGWPTDRPGAIAVLRRAVELGIEFFDTADVYGPFVTDQLLHEALAPYPEQVMIGAKVGSSMQGPGRYTPIGRPEYLRQQTELTLRHLGVETLDLLQLHRIDPLVAAEDQIGELAALRDEGKVRRIGLSEITVDELHAAQQITPIASVQNHYNLVQRKSADVLAECERSGIAFIPWFPLEGSALAKSDGPVAGIAERLGCPPGQVALAWLLHHSPVIIPIPGTKSIAHLDENTAARDITLSDEDVATLDALVAPASAS